MTIGYLIGAQQYRDENNNLHLGKLISAADVEKIVGQTGFVEWNVDPYKDTGKNTARLLRANQTFAIEVDRQYRKRDIGTELMERLFDQLLQDGFEQLIIEGALPSRKSFFNTFFSRLKEKDKVTSYETKIKTYVPFLTPTIPILGSPEITAYKYEVLLNTNPLK